MRFCTGEGTRLSKRELEELSIGGGQEGGKNISSKDAVEDLQSKSEGI